MTNGLDPAYNILPLLAAHGPSSPHGTLPEAAPHGPPAPSAWRTGARRMAASAPSPRAARPTGQDDVCYPETDIQSCCLVLPEAELPDTFTLLALTRVVDAFTLRFGVPVTAVTPTV